MSASIVVIANCQAAGLASCLRLMNPSLTVSVVGIGVQEQAAALRASDFIFVQTHRARAWVDDVLPDIAERAILFPRIYFPAFHPDICYARSAERLISSPLGQYHSKLAITSHLMGMSVAESERLFNGDVYADLGYLTAWSGAARLLGGEIAETDIKLDDAFERWVASGCFMHSINHPKLHVLADVAKALLDHVDIRVMTSRPDRYLRDDLQDSAVWPVFPEIGKALNLEGDYLFKPEGVNATPYDLTAFLAKSFDAYASLSGISVDKLDVEAFCERVAEAVRSGTSSRRQKEPETETSSAGKNPYSDAAPHQIWKRAVVDIGSAEVDPMIAAPFRLSPEHKIATVGSCFAQHISRHLKFAGLNFFVAEAAPTGLSAADAARRGYGQFSARYGNVYTARQLNQLFDRAFSGSDTQEPAWMRPDGRVVDPFRPRAEPEGYADIGEMRAARAEHLGAVRKLFSELDVLVFTLGLTEAWRSKRDGYVFPLAPGVRAGAWTDEYEFVNFTSKEVSDDLVALQQKLKSVNPAARMILTVSPVPLIATYENRHVLVSTTYSKSALRAAVEDVCRGNEAACYFPSYEIVTGNFTRGAYFEDDLRNVTSAGVDHVMRLFLRHFCGQESAPLLSGYDVDCDEEATIPN